MSCLYLGWLIREQIDRAASLSDAIPDRQCHVALARLAEACKDALDEQALQLGRARALLGDDGNAGAAGALRAVKRCTRAMGEIEGYAIPARTASLISPCSSTMSYPQCTARRACRRPAPRWPACRTTTILRTFLHGPYTSPLSEAGFLLHMPDFYHELGHLLHESLNRDARYGPIRDGVANAIGAVDRYYLRQARGTDRGSTPAPARELTAWIWAQWTYRWLLESFCDLFAPFAAGPAYAYSNLHLVSKADTDMYRLNLLGRQDHPSDEARMRLHDAGMRMLGYEEEAAHVRREWDTVARHCGPPRTEYGLVFPSGLLEAIASSILLTFGRAGLRGHRPGGGREPAPAGATPVAALLNDAWRAFWRDGDEGFREQEKAMIAKLAAVAREGAAAC